MRIILATLLILLIASTAWADSFSINEADSALIKCAELYSFSGGNDQYGAKVTFQIGQQITGRLLRAPFQFVTLVDTMRLLDAGTTIDSALGCFVVQSVASLGAGSSVPDSLGITVNPITTLWDEGDQIGTNQGAGVRYDSASATGSGGGGNNPNAPLDWTDGGDFNATPEDDTLYLVGGAVSVNDTLRFKIKGTSIVADTLTGYGWMFFAAYIAEGDDAGSGCSVGFHSDDAATAALQLYLVVFYTPPGEAAAQSGRRRKLLGGR